MDTDRDFGEPGRLERIRTSFPGFATCRTPWTARTARRPSFRPAWQLVIARGEEDEDDSDDGEEDAAYVSVYLELCAPRPAAGVKADVTLRWLNHAGGEDQVARLDAGKVWGAAATKWGFGLFIKRARVLDETDGWLKDGAAVLEADGAQQDAAAVVAPVAWAATICACSRAARARTSPSSSRTSA